MTSLLAGVLFVIGALLAAPISAMTLAIAASDSITLTPLAAALSFAVVLVVAALAIMYLRALHLPARRGDDDPQSPNGDDPQPTLGRPAHNFSNRRIRTRDAFSTKFAKSGETQTGPICYRTIGFMRRTVHAGKDTLLVIVAARTPLDTGHDRSAASEPASSQSPSV